MGQFSLRYLTEVARLRTITKAAAQDAVRHVVSIQIRFVEEGLGAPLLVRHLKAIKPTETGICFVEEAERLLD